MNIGQEIANQKVAIKRRYTDPSRLSMAELYDELPEGSFTIGVREVGLSEPVWVTYVRDLDGKDPFFTPVIGRSTLCRHMSAMDALIKYRKGRQSQTP